MHKIFKILVILGIIATPVQAQDTREEVAPLDPNVLAEIRKAPFSELFVLENVNGEQAYAVKDKDYLGRNNELSVITLWGSVPAKNVLQVIVRYCLPNSDIASEEAHLTQLIIADGDQVLFTLNQEIAGSSASVREVTPSQSVPVYFADPFYDSYMNPFYYQHSYASATYIPPVECSFGGSRFDLNPVKEAIAQLPDKTLDMRLVFSNGIVENWQLGKKTVEQIKQLPSITATP